MMKKLLNGVSLLPVFAVVLVGAGASAQTCRDAVVLVHGNAASTSTWNNTYNELLRRGYASGELFRPNWGSKTCPACNDHDGSEIVPVRDAINQALARSCTGKIDVIGHSMGVTLATKAILDLGVVSRVDALVGIAGAYRGLRSCGTYPYNVATTTCGYWGLSLGSPFLNGIYGKRMAARIYSIKSNSDQVVCSTGVCTVNGVHSSQIANENASYTYSLGHFALQTDTYVKQADLIQ
jgi:pimeloyl-ACP methyl ester carboxylesterase